MAATDERPFPPGDYPVVVVGSGPGGLQTSYCLSRLGVEHAVVSADEEPGGMFRLYPIFQRLLSWSKPDAPAERGTRTYEWFDHNSLLAEEIEHQALVPRFMDRTFMVPSRSEMEQGLAAFANRVPIRVRYGCRWEATRRGEDGRLVLTTSDGEYRCRAAVFAVGVTTPWKSPIPGIEQVPHYVECGDPPDYRGRRVFVVGKRNSGFEIADGLLPWARQVILGSPRPVQTSVIALSTVRVRYLQPYEDYGLGGGTFALDLAVERIERRGERWGVVGQGTTRPGPINLEVDDVLAATGFSTPLLDLPALGVRTVAQGRIPALTPFWESAPGSGIYFAGNATQGAAGLRKHGVGASSAAVHGFRYNARVMAAHLAANHLGVRAPRERVEPDRLVQYLLEEVSSAPELWAQKSYLARAVAEGGATDILPLAGWLDDPGGRSTAVAVEMNAAGEVYPAVYVANGGGVREILLPPHELNDFRGADYERELRAVL
ncbi:MAG TPA: NAD(P)-binding domain-containing protein [Gaiellaceae bacterium]|nr:NAD(P)-binding domain-containing protein [Gaiellaceae bacterium]